jgi:hypothetical protein
MTDRQWLDWFEAAWKDREERLYPSLFGSTGAGIFTLDQELFEKQFHIKTVDPRWLSHGVFECPPTANRDSWLYVSSGLSNAWEDDQPRLDSPSGLGCELIIQCRRQSRWAVLLLRSMTAFQILLSCGHYPGKALLSFWDRIPLRQPIDGEGSRLTFVLVTPANGFEGLHQLSSGRFEFLQFVGITEQEAEYAREQGTSRLFELLLAQRAAPVVVPERHPLRLG